MTNEEISDQLVRTGKGDVNEMLRAKMITRQEALRALGRCALCAGPNAKEYRGRLGFACFKCWCDYMDDLAGACGG